MDKQEPTDPKEFATSETGAKRSVLYKLGPSGFPIRLDLMLANDVGARRLAEAFGEGSIKYAPNNWKKGFPESVMINHVMEHLRKHLAGDISEDHLSHACWGIYCLMFIQEKLPHLMDLTGKKTDLKPWPEPGTVVEVPKGVSPRDWVEMLRKQAVRAAANLD